MIPLIVSVSSLLSHDFTVPSIDQVSNPLMGISNQIDITGYHDLFKQFKDSQLRKS
jgi:hypothetical protein